MTLGAATPLWGRRPPLGAAPPSGGGAPLCGVHRGHAAPLCGGHRGHVHGTARARARDGRCAESLEALPPPPHAHTPKIATPRCGGIRAPGGGIQGLKLKNQPRMYQRVIWCSCVVWPTRSPIYAHFGHTASGSGRARDDLSQVCGHCCRYIQVRAIRVKVRNHWGLMGSLLATIACPPCGDQ